MESRKNKTDPCTDNTHCTRDNPARSFAVRGSTWTPSWLRTDRPCQEGSAPLPCLAPCSVTSSPPGPQPAAGALSPPATVSSGGQLCSGVTAMAEEARHTWNDSALGAGCLGAWVRRLCFLGPRHPGPRRRKPGPPLRQPMAAASPGVNKQRERKRPRVKAPPDAPEPSACPGGTL